jgi:hypothetical protein
MIGGPISLFELEIMDGAFRAAAAITSLWSAGKGGGVMGRDRMLLALLRRLAFFLGEGGDIGRSMPAEAIEIELR